MRFPQKAMIVLADLQAAHDQIHSQSNFFSSSTLLFLSIIIFIAILSILSHDFSLLRMGHYYYLDSNTFSNTSIPLFSIRTVTTNKYYLSIFQQSYFVILSNSISIDNLFSNKRPTIVTEHTGPTGLAETFFGKHGFPL